MTPSPAIQGLFRSLPNEDPTPKEDDEPRIAINSLTNKAGTFYEKIRYLVDYQEEHAIRRSAIERILRRKILLEGATNIGLPLLQELIAGSYVPNNEIPDHIAFDLDRIINKYRRLLSANTTTGDGKQSRQKNILNIISTEIELYLYPQPLNEALADAFYLTIREAILYPPYHGPELDMQVYIACRRSLLKENDARLRFDLWRRYLPAWESDMHETISTEEALDIIERINRDLANQISWHIVPKLRNETIYFSVLREVLVKYGSMTERMFEEDTSPDLDSFIRTFLKEQNSTTVTKARTSGIRAVVYILITKVVLALAIELPYEFTFLQEVNYIALGSNIVFHPLLLLVMTRWITPPSSKNTDAIIRGVHGIVEGAKILPKAIRSAKRNTGFTVALSVLYLLLFCITFGLIVGILRQLAFNSVSILLFLLFLTLVSYFGLRIRYNARAWKVTTEEGALALFWGIFTLPIMRVGRWLSIKFTSINVFVFILDFIIETPFKLLLRVLDAFITFLKEIREQTY